MKQLMLCMLLYPPAAAPPAPPRPLATARFCVLYRVFDKGKQKTEVFADGEVKIEGSDITIAAGPTDPDPNKFRIMTVTLTAKEGCLPGEWSILNESVYQLDWFGESHRKSAVTIRPDYFRPHSPSGPTPEYGKMRVSFLIPIKSDGPESARFSFYIFCDRANPDCIVCPSPGAPRPLLKLEGFFERGISWTIVLDRVESNPSIPVSPENYFPTTISGCGGPFPVLPNPSCPLCR
jgi:hypothetical protein